MQPTPRFSRRLISFGMLGTLVCLGLALASSCSKRSVLGPLAVTPSAPGAVVAGAVRLQNDSHGVGIVVTLEPVVGGVAASVRRVIDDAASQSSTTSGRRAPLAATGSAATGVRAVVTDALGRYAFDGVAQGDYVVSAATRNYLAGNMPVRINSTLTDTTYVNISLKPTGTFSGLTTLENATTHPSSVMYVVGTSYVAVTNASGAWVMRGVPIGAHTLTGTHAGWLDRSTTGTLGFAGDSVAVPNLVLPLNRDIVPVATASAGGSCSLTPYAMNGSGTDVAGTIVL